MSRGRLVQGPKMSTMEKLSRSSSLSSFDMAESACEEAVVSPAASAEVPPAERSLYGRWTLAGNVLGVGRFVAVVAFAGLVGTVGAFQWSLKRGMEEALWYMGGLTGALLRTA